MGDIRYKIVIFIREPKEHFTTIIHGWAAPTVHDNNHGVIDKNYFNRIPLSLPPTLTSSFPHTTHIIIIAQILCRNGTERSSFCCIRARQETKSRDPDDQFTKRQLRPETLPSSHRSRHSRTTCRCRTQRWRIGPSGLCGRSRFRDPRPGAEHGDLQGCR